MEPKTAPQTPTLMLSMDASGSLRGWWKCCSRLILCGALLGAVGLLGGCASLGRRIALPPVLRGQPQGQLPADPAYELVVLRTKDGTKIVGQFGHALLPPAASSANAAATRAPTVIFFYGSKQNLTAPHNRRVFQTLRTMGVNVFIPEYPGIGMSEGTTGERQCCEAADAALDYLLTRPDIDPARIIAIGQSLGSGPAVDLASRRKLAGLVTVGGFTSGADAATSGVSWMPHWLARSLMADCRFENSVKMKTVTCPILLVYGTRDAVVPPWMAERLAEAAGGPVTKLAVDSEHNSLWKSPRFGLNVTVQQWLHAR